MIRINLLPEEFRKKSRTPLKLLFTITGLVAVNAGLASWWGWTVFGIHAKVESERATLQVEMDGLTPQVNYYHSLETESKQYKSREKTLGQITADRISWTRKLDELIDVANAGGDGSRHLVWLDDLTVAQSNDASTKNYGSVRASGHSGSDKFAQVANFLEDVEGSAFIDDFEKPSPPEGTQTLVDETLVPPVAWAFPLALSLKAPEERAKATIARTTKAVKDPASANGAKGSAKPDDSNAAKPDATKPDAPKSDPAKPDAPKSDAPKPDAPKSDAPKSDAPVAPKADEKPESKPEPKPSPSTPPSPAKTPQSGSKPGAEVQ